MPNSTGVRNISIYNIIIQNINRKWRTRRNLNIYYEYINERYNKIFIKKTIFKLP